MPLVLVTANRKDYAELTDAYLRFIGEKLRWWVAEALTCTEPDGQLSSKDIEVKISIRSDQDVGGEEHALEIVIFANDYPSRKQNLDFRRSLLLTTLKAELRAGLHGYVWVLLTPASFGTF